MLATLNLDRIKLRELRRERRMTGTALAQAVGVGRTYVSQLESGARTPSDELIERFAEALGVGPEALCQDVSEGSESMCSDPRERFLVDVFRSLDEDSKADLVAQASRLVGRRAGAQKNETA